MSGLVDPTRPTSTLPLTQSSYPTPLSKLPFHSLLTFRSMQMGEGSFARQLVERWAESASKTITGDILVMRKGLVISDAQLDSVLVDVSVCVCVCVCVSCFINKPTDRLHHPYQVMRPSIKRIFGSLGIPERLVPSRHVLKKLYDELTSGPRFEPTFSTHTLPDGVISHGSTYAHYRMRPPRRSIYLLGKLFKLTRPHTHTLHAAHAHTPHTHMHTCTRTHTHTYTRARTRVRGSAFYSPVDATRH